MKQEFPILSEEQVTLVRADALTGHVLDDEFKLHASKAQNYYSIFNNYEDAISYIESVVKKMPNMEAVIYNSRKELLYYYNPFGR